MRPMGCQSHCQILTKLSLPSADAHKELLQIVQDMPRRNMAERGQMGQVRSCKFCKFHFANVSRAV